jgi:hypothetical protein
MIRNQASKTGTQKLKNMRTENFDVGEAEQSLGDDISDPDRLKGRFNTTV